MAEFYSQKPQRENKPLLNNINFTLHRGERLGVIGQNGSGKTTLLRVLGGIYRHNSGELITNGTPQGLLNIQLGTDPGATGIENIYLRGLQMGLTLSQIRDCIPDVLEFSELGSDLNKLFGNYSAGMRLRLGVAISTMVKPDILIMDEWVGAGDDAFRKKVSERMTGLVKESNGLVVASHSKKLLRSVCTHGLVIDKGSIKFHGPIGQALKFYADINSEKPTAADTDK